MEEEVNSGARTVSRQHDTLSQTLENPEHPGRVRGMGVRVGFKDAFGGSKSRGKREKQDAKMERLRQQMQQEHDKQMVEMESRIFERLSSQFRQQYEHPPPTSPGFRRSSQASGTWGDALDNLKVILVHNHN